MTQKTIKTGKEFRHATFQRDAINVDSRTVELSFASEEPYERWFGMEILDCAPQSVNLTRLGNMPLLLDHDPSKLIGTIETATVGNDRVGRAVVRFGRSALANEAFQDVQDGIRKSVSVGYEINELTLVSDKQGEPPVYRAVQWTPFELSLVAVPADATVGVGRAAEQRDITTIISISVDADTDDDEDEEDDIEDPNDPAATTDPTPDPNPTPETIMPDPDIQVITAAKADAQKIERQRVADILAMGETHAKRGGEKLATAAIRAGKSAEEFRVELLDHLSKPENQERTVNLTEKEEKQYSYARAIAAALAMAEGRSVSGFEVDIHEEMEKNLPKEYKRNGGIIVPLELRKKLQLQRAPVANTLYDAATLGAESVFTQRGEFIDLLRNASVLVKKGARVISGLTGPISFPKQTGAATMTWLAENGGVDAGATNLTLGSAALSAKTLQGTTGFSRQLLAQSSLDVEMLVREDLAAGHGLAWDKAGLHGAGASNEPTGIYIAGSVNAVAMGGIPTFGKLIDMISAVLSHNALFGSLGFATTPGMAGKMAQTLVASAAGSDMIWTGKLDNGVMAGYEAMSSNQVSSTLGAGAEHGIVFGNWADLLIGMWGGLELVVDPYSLKKQGLIEVTSFQMVDIALRHAESFSKSTGATIV